MLDDNIKSVRNIKVYAIVSKWLLTLRPPPTEPGARCGASIHVWLSHLYYEQTVS